MSAPKTIYVEFNMKSKMFRFLATPQVQFEGGEFIYFPIDEDMPVYELMDSISQIK